MINKTSLFNWGLFIAALAGSAGHLVLAGGFAKPTLIGLAVVAAGGLLLALGLALRGKVFGVWLTFLGAILVAAGGVGSSGFGTFKVANPIGWVALGATGLIAIVSVMEWAERSEERRPTRNF